MAKNKNKKSSESDIEYADPFVHQAEIPSNPLEAQRRSTSPYRKQASFRPPEGKSSIHGANRNPLSVSSSDLASLGLVYPTPFARNRQSIVNSYNPFDDDKYNGCIIAEGIRQKVKALLDLPKHVKIISKMRSEIEG
jgi:hypothetical protein